MIGKMRHRVALQAESRAPDAAGGYAVTWTTVATVWARIEPQGAGETVAAGQLTAPVSHRVTVRRRSDISPTASMRLLFGSRVFDIRGVLNQDEGNRYLVLICEENVVT